MGIHFEDDIVSLKKLTEIVFFNINDYTNNLSLMINKGILTPKDDHVDEINDILI